MVDKKLSEFSAVQASDVSDLVVLYLDGNNTTKNGRLPFSTFVSGLALLSGNNTFTGTNTFEDDVVFSGDTTFNNPINGTCSRAVADGDGNSFATTYSKINQPATVLTYSSTVSLLTNKIYTLTLSGNVTFSLPQATAGVLNQIEVQLYMPSVYTITLGTTTYFGGEAPDISEAGYYTLIYEYDNVHSVWVVGALKKASA